MAKVEVYYKKKDPKNLIHAETSFNVTNVHLKSGFGITRLTNGDVEVIFVPNLNAVPDVWRYLIKIDNGRITKLNPSYPVHCKFNTQSFYSKNDINLKTCRNCSNKNNCSYWNLQSIILVLESPHTDEFVQNTLHPKAPAQGQTNQQTGKPINDKLIDCLSTVYNSYFTQRIQQLKNGSYRIIICEPAPYQCSLGVLTNTGLNRKLTDKVWRKTWKIKHIKRDYISRIYTYKPYLIINACTSSLKGLVKTQIKEINSTKFNNKLLTVSSNHPCRNQWASSKFNIKII